MDFELDGEQKLLRDTTRGLLERSYDAETLAAVKASPRGWSADVWRRLAETGLLGLGFDDEDGGSG
ncbi:MAG: acyl-CoA dehydrogenase family protein, partial [Nocardiaceae bacterium]|nr:acyl-CoA dehydrogenase family protein [Nocardiaceae bacterium]